MLCRIDLVVREERGTLLVGRGRALRPAVLLASPSRDGNCDGGHEQDGHDGEGEDPLECDKLVEELCDANGGSENAEGEAHGVVLVVVSMQEVVFRQEAIPCR